MEEKILKLKDYIISSKKILLINHRRMDPDAFGSLSTFYYILKNNLKKEVEAINDDFRPNNFSFLDENQIFKPELDIKKFNPDIIISFDAASIEQLGEIYQNNKKIFKEKILIVIDHHITNPGFGNLNIIDVKASSTCELVFEILEKFNWIKYITPKIATFLNAGILTDTNMYYNKNTTPKTLEIASKLLKLGSNFRAPIFEFFKKKSFEKTKLFGIALERVEKKGTIAYTYLNKNDFKNTKTTDQDTNGIIDIIINIDGVEVAFIVYSLDKGGNKISFRSKELNVAKICESFGGGGHKLAAGFQTEKKQNEIIKELINTLKKES